MNLLSELEYYKRLWAAAVPSVIETPPDQTFMLWMSSVSRAGLEHAIRKTGRKMLTNLSNGVRLVEHAAPRYCSSIVGRWVMKGENNENH